MRTMGLMLAALFVFLAFGEAEVPSGLFDYPVARRERPNGQATMTNSSPVVIQGGLSLPPIETACGVGKLIGSGL